MKYSDATIEKVAIGMEAHGSILHTDWELARMALNALENTDEQKALRAFERAYLEWAMPSAGGQAEGLAFIDLVEAYDALEKTRS